MSQGFERKGGNGNDNVARLKKGNRVAPLKALKKGARVIKPRRPSAILQATRKKTLTSKHIKQSEEFTSSLLGNTARAPPTSRKSSKK